MSTTNQPPGRGLGGASAAMGVALATSLLLAACGGSGTPSSSAAPAGSSSATPSVGPATPSATAAVSSTRPSVAAAIPDGVWVSDPISAATVRAMFAATHLSAADKQRGLTDDFGMTPTRKQMIEQLELKDGSWIQSASWDGAPMAVGAKGSYAFPDATTIAMQDNVSLITYRVTLSGTSLKLTMQSDSAWTGDPADDVEPTIVFCTAAFHRQG